jgi:heat shock protein Hsp20
VTKTTK